MIDVSKLQLERQYRSKVNHAKDSVISKNPDLVKPNAIELYQDEDKLNKLLYKNPNHKAYSITSEKKVYLSDTVCELSERELAQVILHEMIHLTFPKMDENEVVLETQRRSKDVISIIMNL